MQRSPKSVLRERDDFGRIYGDRDINEKRHSRQPGNKTYQEQRAANNLDHSDKPSHGLRPRNADFHKASDSERGGEQKLLYSFGKKDPTHKNTDEQDRFRRSIHVACLCLWWHWSVAEQFEFRAKNERAMDLSNVQIFR